MILDGASRVLDRVEKCLSRFDGSLREDLLTEINVAKKGKSKATLGRL